MLKNQHLNKITMAILFFVALIVLLPVIWILIGSFSTNEQIDQNYSIIYDVFHYNETYATWRIPYNAITLQQYVALLLQRLDILLHYWNGLYLVVPITAFGAIIAAAGGYALAKFEFWGKKAILFSYILVMLLPLQVTLVPAYIFFNEIHLTGTRLAVILPGIFAPFGTFLIYQFMRKIPDETIENAGLDGAAPLRIFASIIVPQCKTGMIAYGVLIVVDYWNMIEQPIMLLQDETLYPLSVMLRNINQYDIGIAFASGILYMIPLVLLFFIVSDDLVEGIGNTIPQFVLGRRKD